MITQYREGAILEWIGHLLVPGIFDGRHRFEFTALPDGTTHLVQSEQFAGITIPLVGGISKNTKLAFEQLNAALAARCTNTSA